MQLLNKNSLDNGIRYMGPIKFPSSLTKKLNVAKIFNVKSIVGTYTYGSSTRWHKKRLPLAIT